MEKKMKKDKRKGFTLVELLATIVILSLVVGFTIYIAIGYINGTREKGYKTTIVNIEDEARSYLLENSDRLFYISSSTSANVEYQCLTVGNLIDYGFFKGDVLDSEVKKNQNVSEDDYIYIERDKTTKAIRKSQYILDDENLKKTCNVAVKATGDISIQVEPSGWSSYKNISINYKIKNANDINNYEYVYSYSKSGVVSVITNEKMSKKIKVTDNGVITAKIIYTKDGSVIAQSSKTITNIDKTPPVITMGNLVKTYGTSFNLYEGVTITDNSGIVASKKVYLNGKEITNSSQIPAGAHTVTYEAKDQFGNTSRKDRKIYLVTGAISIGVEPSGLSKYKDITITYSVKDAVDANDYEYVYSYSKSGVVSVITNEKMSKKIKVTDNGTITAKIIYKKDRSVVAESSKNITDIDNIPPVITMSNLTKVYGVSFDLYEGVTITDNSGVVASKKVYLGGKEITNSSQIPVGDNTVTYEAVDKVGNVSRKNRKITLAVANKEFDYKEYDQVYQVEADGTYIVEAYGAQGGNNGGKGGYVKAEITLKRGDKLIINTGGVNGYNGGGAYKNSEYIPGGGATTIRYNSKYVIIAAGGGAKGTEGTPSVGGTGNAAGGADVGAGAGLAGSNGGGGSSSSNYSYQCNCETCGGECTNWKEECKTCHGKIWIGSACPPPPGQCEHYYEYTEYPCACNPYCASSKPTYECNCQTCTKNGQSGNGGTSKVASPAGGASMTAGSRAGNGYAKVSYKIGG